LSSDRSLSFRIHSRHSSGHATPAGSAPLRHPFASAAFHRKCRHSQAGEFVVRTDPAKHWTDRSVRRTTQFPETTTKLAGLQKGLSVGRLTVICHRPFENYHPFWIVWPEDIFNMTTTS
jgi:hypothetical protein